jgi:cell division GTPase FtsZ
LCPANIERASKVFKCLANNSDDLFAIKNEKLKEKEPKKDTLKTKLG